MRIPSLRVSMLVASAGLLCAAALASAWQPASGGQPEPRQGQPGQQGPGGPRRQGQGQAPSLDGSMKQMNRALKQLRGQLKDTSKREENLKVIGDMQRGAVGAKSAKPERAMSEAKDEAAKAKIAADFRSELITVVRRLLDAEEAIVNGKPEVAAAALDEVEKMRDKAHMQLGVRDDE